MAAAQERQNQLTKPPGSLGRLEELSVQLAGITGDPLPRLERTSIVVFAGDHGVTEEGVSPFPSEVTRQMLLNFVNEGAAVSVLARQAQAQLCVVDVGTFGEALEVDEGAGPVVPESGGRASTSEPDPGVELRVDRVRTGTANIARGPAMSRRECLEAIERGSSAAEREIARGADLLGVGEMGIGNTTPSSAIVAVLGGHEVSVVTGPGTGLDDEGLRHKIEVIERAIAVNNPDPQDAVEVLHRVGGLELAAMVGYILTGAAHQVPVLLDGFITGAAALAAGRICPQSVEYMIAAHSSAEPGHRLVLEELQLKPLLTWDLRLGEASGAALVVPLVQASTALLRDMATFEEANIAGADESAQD
jgi:nicotinate-nucleotide--dimethylbenzimidazole phosphoribosyltransferase